MKKELTKDSTRDLMENKDLPRISYRHEDTAAKEIIIMGMMVAMDMEVAPEIMVDTVAKDLVGGPVADLEVTVAAEEATEVDTVADTVVDMEEDTIKDMIMEVAMIRATTKVTTRDMTRVMIIMVEAVAEAVIAAMNWQKMSNHQSLWRVIMMRNLDQSILRLVTLRSHLVISYLVIWRNQRDPSQRSNFNQFYELFVLFWLCIE